MNANLEANLKAMSRNELFSNLDALKRMAKMFGPYDKELTAKLRDRVTDVWNELNSRKSR